MISGSTWAQSLFDFNGVDPSALSNSQLDRIAGITNDLKLSDIKYSTIDDFGAINVDGKMRISHPSSFCGELVFEPLNFQYNSESDYFWYGEIDNEPGVCSSGQFVMKKKGDLVFGNFSIDDDIYMFLSFGPNKLVFGKSESGIGAFCGVNSEGNSMNPPPSGAPESLKCKIKTQIVYDPSHWSVFMANFIEDIISDYYIQMMNMHFVNSSIYSTEMELASADPISGLIDDDPDLTEREENIKNLNNMLTENHPVRIELDELRSKNGADIVMAVLPAKVLALGRAVVGATDLESAVGLTTLSGVALEGNNFSHEVGHIIGAGHEEDDPAGGDVANAHKVKRVWRNGKTITYAVLDKRHIPYFSNPDVEWKGKPTGTDQNNNAKVIREAGCFISELNNPGGPIPFSIIKLTAPFEACPFDLIFAEVSTTPGNHAYQWSWSLNGTDYTNVPGGTGSSLWWTVLPSSGILFLKITVNPEDGSAAQSLIQHIFQENNCFQGENTESRIIEQFEEIKVFPNPTKELVNITGLLTKFESQKITIKLFDIQGSLIKILLEGEVNSNSFDFYLGNLPSAQYYIEIKNIKNSTSKIYEISKL